MDCFEKIPPHSIEIENELIGSLILSPENFNEISSILDENSFYSEKNSIIFKAIKKLNSNGVFIDLPILTLELKNSSKLEQIGGALALTKIVSSSSFNSDIQLFAKIIKENHVKRQMIAVLGDLTQKLYNNDEDVENLIFTLQKASNDLEKNFDCIDSGMTSEQVAKEALEEIYSDYEKVLKNETTGIDTGFSKLNNLIGGFKKSTFIVLAARPGVGKTSVALHFAQKAAIIGKWVNFFSFEMTKSQLFKIALSGDSGVDRTNIRDGKLNGDELRLLNKSVSFLEKMPILWTSKRMNISQVKSSIRKNVRRNKCDLVIIDYLQLIDPSDKRVVREQQISEISRELKAMTIEFNIPIIALSQLNRLAETEVPQLRHLRESGAIEQDADNVMFIYKEVDGDFNEISYSIINAKARNGSTGKFDVWHNEQMTKFGNKSEENVNNYNPDYQFQPMQANNNFDDSPF